MTAELLKLRRLPTPLVVLALALLAIATAALITYFVQPDDTDYYWRAPLVTATVVVEIAGIIVGVWLIGMEFAQGTVRRLLTADPRRGVVVAKKLLALLLAALAASALTALVAYWLGALASELRDVDYDHATAGKMAGVVVITGVLTALLAFALGLLAESLVGGVVLAFVVVFVLDGVLSFVSAIQDYTFAAALGSMSSAADPTQASAIGFWGGLGVAVAWVAVLLAPGVVRFLRTDFK